MNLQTTIRNTLLLICASATLLIGEDKPPEDKFFDSDGVRIHYIESGSGVPVILLHGFAGNTEFFLDTNIFQSLSKEYRVIAMDARGRGKSDKPHEPDLYGRKMSEDIVRLLDHLGISKAHVLGFSNGTRILSKTLTEHESRFHSAIMAGFAPVWDWTAEEQREIEQRYKDTLNSTNPRYENQDTEALAASVLGFPELVVGEQEIKDLELPIIAIVGSEDDNLERVKRFEKIKPTIDVVVIERYSQKLWIS